MRSRVLGAFASEGFRFQMQSGSEQVFDHAWSSFVDGDASGDSKLIPRS